MRAVLKPPRFSGSTYLFCSLYIENLFASSFLWKIEISPTHCRNLKYDSGQEIWPRHTRPGDISQRERSKFATCKQRADLIRNRRERIFNRRQPSRAQGRKAWQAKIWDDANEDKLKGLVKDLEATDRRLILRAKNTGSWLTVQDTKVTGTVLASKKFHDFLYAHYGVIYPPPKKNDGCSFYFSVPHGLSCRNGGLVLTRHNRVRGKLLFLTIRAFPSNCVHGETLIQHGHRRSYEEVSQGKGGLYTRGKILIQGL